MTGAAPRAPATKRVATYTRTTTTRPSNRGLTAYQPPMAPLPYDPGYAALGGPAPIIVQAKPSWSRPGVVTAACIVAFVFAAISLLAAVFWFAIADVDDLFGSSRAEYVLRGIANTVVAGALMLGGIMAITRQSWGRFLAMGGAGALAAYSVYRLTDGYYLALFDIFVAATVIALLSVPRAGRYYAMRSPVGFD